MMASDTRRNTTTAKRLICSEYVAAAPNRHVAETSPGRPACGKVVWTLVPRAVHRQPGWALFLRLDEGVFSRFEQGEAAGATPEGRGIADPDAQRCSTRLLLEAATDALDFRDHLSGLIFEQAQGELVTTHARRGLAAAAALAKEG